MSACARLPTDQANVTVYTAVATVAAGIAGVLIALAIAADFWVAQLVLGFLAALFAAVAEAFFMLAADAAWWVGFDESLLDSAQRAWQSAVAAVRTACCPAWITMNTDDLVCP